MHIPDGFLNTATTGVAWVASAGGLGYATHRLRHEMEEGEAPLMGITAAFIFAAQMMNVTVAGGTSGHLLGAALATLLLGPWGGMVAIAAVLAVQALIFQDGGLIALGPNILNLAVVGVLVAWGVQRAVLRLMQGRAHAQSVAAFVSAWFSVMVAALIASIELGLSGASPWGLVIPAMEGVHAVIGVVEGLITVAVLAFVRAARPDLVHGIAAPLQISVEQERS